MNSSTKWLAVLVLLVAVIAAAMLLHMQFSGQGQTQRQARKAHADRPTASAGKRILKPPASAGVEAEPVAQAAPHPTGPETASRQTMPGAAQKVPLVTALPRPQLVGTPPVIKIPPNLLEPELTSLRPDFMVPPGCTNLAAGKKVTSSDPEPLVGELGLITDGDKATEEGSYVELAAGKQWVQIDLGLEAELFAVLVWHFHGQRVVYRGVMLQVSDDPAFVTGVQSVFNNDYENGLGLGAGQDLAYIENYQGKLIDTKGVRGRYVRLWSNGSTAGPLNRYIEVEVWGRPAQ